MIFYHQSFVLRDEKYFIVHLYKFFNTGKFESKSKNRLRMKKKTVSNNLRNKAYKYHFITSLK